MTAHARYNMGIDGEGRGRYPHRYVMLAASNESGTIRRVIERDKGLPTESCLDFILSLPQNARLFGFSFNYDLTMMLKDLSNEALYLLFRPESRQRPKGASKSWEPIPVRWVGKSGKAYSLNLIGSQFRVTCGKITRVIWDVFKFYQTSFVKALGLWKCSPLSHTDKVGDNAYHRISLEQMKELKDQRSEFDTVPLSTIRGYCFDECSYLSELIRKLDEAHGNIKLFDKNGAPATPKLRRYDGAGSTSGAFLRIWNIHDLRADGPREMRDAVHSAFFGGRFEHSIIGTVGKTIYSYDIASAYPYQMRFLPCLKHGTWTLTRDKLRIKAARTALVNYDYAERSDEERASQSWAPFPFREEDGAICYPTESGGGWLWRDEFLAGAKVFAHVRILKAWVYESSCACIPFAQVPICYLNRLKIGKNGPGIVLKLGMNGGYGKMAQSVGHAPPFQCWIWAGMITAGTRAQMLDMMGLHKNLNNLLSVATDGLYTREKLETPTPKDTGTFRTIDDELMRHPNYPLGAWELKTIDRPMFFARPGIYYPLSPKEDEVETLRARGIGRKSLFDNNQAIIDAFEAGKKEIHLNTIQRFGGAKTNISASRNVSRPIYKRSSRYGNWVDYPVDMAFDPMPKRASIEMLPRTGRSFIRGRLLLRTIDRSQKSAPYEGKLSADAKAIKASEQLDLEQPDGCGELEEAVE